MLGRNPKEKAEIQKTAENVSVHGYVSKKRIIAIASVIIIIVVLSAIILNQLEKKREIKNQKVYDPELARSMTYEQVVEGEEAIENCPYVNFDAFFLRDLDGDGEAEGIRGTCKHVESKDTLYMEFSVNTEGYLKNGKINIDGKNFRLETSIPKENESGEIAENAIGENIRQIVLRDIHSGTQKLLTGVIKSKSRNDINWYSDINSISLTGIYVGEDGTEIEINKTVELAVDWYGEAIAKIDRIYQEGTLSEIFDEENQEINLKFFIDAEEYNKKLHLSKMEIKAVIPQLNGYNPKRLESTNSDYEYNEITREVSITKTAQVNEKGEIINRIYSDNVYNFKITYPLEAYQSLGEDTVEIRIPTQLYYEAFNNPNEEFKNPYISNIAKSTIIVNFKNPRGNVTDIMVRAGIDMGSKYVISKQKPLNIYNGIAQADGSIDTYIVRWLVTMGANEQSEKVILKETADDKNQVSDLFITKDNKEESMSEITQNIGIYFWSPEKFVGEDGWIKIYDDETKELIITFDKSNWDKCTAANPYMYEIPIKHIKVETSEAKPNESISIVNIKELDDEYIAEHYTLEQFKNLEHIKSTLTGYFGERYITTDMHSAKYEEATSDTYMEIKNHIMSTQETKDNVEIKIITEGNEYNNKAKWLNGTFLLKFPEEILNVEINEIEIDNQKVKIIGRDVYKEANNIFVKVTTENEISQFYTITIDCKLTSDPRIATTNSTIFLYTNNEECPNYLSKVKDIYDINGNCDTEDFVGKNSVSVSLVAPSSLLTYQEAKEYDREGNNAIAPEIALVEKDQRKATIQLGITNNYSNTVSDIQILGRIPAIDNSYVITKEKLNSEFNTTMTNAGIQVPEELEKMVKVYYSEKIDATKELTDTNNNWQETPDDWSKVKSFLIDINSYTMKMKEKQVFSYQIEIPEGINYNQISYSHHGVYFKLDTTEGQYKTQVQPNKLGIMIARQFDIELTKYQKGTNKVIPEATYTIAEEGKTEGNTKITDMNGKISLKSLYAERTYIIKEIKSPQQYELNEKEIKFTTNVNAEGELKANLIDGTPLVVNKTETGYTVLIETEDEVRPNLKIVKTDKKDNTALPKIRYKITGKGIIASGRTIITDENGQGNIIGLYVNEEYTLTEIKADGYYIEEPIKFVIEHTNEGYSIRINAGTIKNSNITLDNQIPTATLNIENEKIPTYSLNITKYNKDNKNELLEGAKFRLLKDNKLIDESISDSNGNITFNNLYQYVDSKKINQTYVLREVLSPVGYAKTKDITFKVEEIDGQLKFEEEIKEGSTCKEYEAEGNTIKLLIPDAPSFKLIKKDGTTAELLPGIKFAIYNIDDETIPAKDSKGNILGRKERIKGKEYYVVETNEKGEITADLTEGLYKAVEVEAPEQYDIEGNTYYFGIGTSKEGKKEYQLNNTKNIGTSRNGVITTTTITQDGEILAGGYFTGTLQLENGIQLKSNGSRDALIIRYDSNLNVVWAKSFGGTYNDEITCIDEAPNGEIFVGGYFIQYAEEPDIEVGNGVILHGWGESAMILKYTPDGEVIWGGVRLDNTNSRVKHLISTKDNGVIIEGELGYEEEGSPEMIKYNTNGEIVQKLNYFPYIFRDMSYINMISTSDNGILVISHSQTIANQANGGKFDIKPIGDNDIRILKYDSTGELSWVKQIGGIEDDRFSEAIKTKNNEIILIGYFKSTEIKLEDGRTLSNSGNVIMKLNESGEVIWAKNIGGTNQDKITSIYETENNEIIVTGYFTGKTIELENGTILYGNSKKNGMIIKYDKNGNIQLAKKLNTGILTNIMQYEDEETISGTNENNQEIATYKTKEIPEIETKATHEIKGEYKDIRVIESADDGGHFVGGGFSGTIELENGETLTSENDTGIIIKYNAIDKIEFIKTYKNSMEMEYQSESYNTITTIAKTKDGGYIVGGEFKGKIEIDENKTLQTAYYDEVYIWEGMIIKYNKANEVEWTKKIVKVSNGDNGVRKIIITANEEIVVLADLSNGSVELENGKIFSLYDYEDYRCGSLIMKYNKEGELIWANIVKIGTGEITAIAETTEGEILLGGIFQDVINFDGKNILTTLNWPGDNIILKYDTEGNVNWYKQLEWIYLSNPYQPFITTSNGGYITFTTYGGAESIMTQYNKNGQVEWEKEFAGKEILGIHDNNIISYYNGTIYNYNLRGEKELECNYNIDMGDVWYWGSLDLINDGSIVLADTGLGIITKIKMEIGIPEIQELTIENYLKEFNITTKARTIGGNEEETGGEISGEGEKPYEKVIYGENSTKEIILMPYEEYEILQVTVNGKNYPFELSEGQYKIAQFTEMKEHKYVEVTYIKRENKLTLSKVDNNTKEPLAEAEFNLNLQEIDVLNELQPYPIELCTITFSIINGTWDGLDSSSKTVVLLKGSILGDNLPYDMVPNKGFSEENGVWDREINEYTEVTGNQTYTFTFIASAIIPPSMPMSTPTQILSETLINEDITSENTNGYTFVKQNGIYKSNNQGKQATMAVAYTPVYLESYTNYFENVGEFQFNINASISSEEEKDNGYIILSDMPPEEIDFSMLLESINNGDIPDQAIKISGNIENEEYTLPVMYCPVNYLIFIYEKDADGNAGEDTFTINSAKLVINEEWYTEVTTNEIGKATTNVPIGTYEITEIKTPEGYIKLEYPIKIKFTEDISQREILENQNDGIEVTVSENGEFVIGNQKLSEVLVHHYLKDRDGNPTEIQVAEDDIYKSKKGEKYTTRPHINLEKYELEKDENGDYIIPKEANGTYADQKIVVNYYYVERKIPLTVHHYIENTETLVPLEEGITLESITPEGYTYKEGSYQREEYEGSEYTTSAIPNEKLSNEYELVEIPENANGTHIGTEVTVNYYYRKITRKVNIIKHEKDSEIPLVGAKFTITKIEQQENPQEETIPDNTEIPIYTTNEQGKINITLEAGEYEITEIEAPPGYQLPENPTRKLSITRETTEENLEIENDKIKGKVTVYHYIKGTTEPVKIINEETNEIEDVKPEEKTGYIGEMYATKEKDKLDPRYIYDSVVGETSGEYSEGTKEVIYYYKEVIDIDVVKKWNHTDNIYEKPESLTLEIYSNDVKIDELTLTAKDKVPIEDELESEETWKRTIENLPKYDEENNEIVYRILEKKVE